MRSKQKELTKLPYDAEKLIEHFKEKHPDTFEAFVRGNTPHYYTEGGVEYLYRGISYKLESMDVLPTYCLLNYVLLDHSNKDRHGSKIQFSTKDPELYQLIKRKDETVEFKENIIDSGRFKNYQGEWYDITVEFYKTRDRYGKLDVQLKIWNNLNRQFMYIRFHADRKYKWSVNLTSPKASSSMGDLLCYTSQKHMRLLVELWLRHGEDFLKFQVGDQCVYYGKNENMTYGKKYICLDRGSTGEVKILQDDGTERWYNMYYFVSVADYRRYKIKSLDFI
jgi:hypothetical protein